MSDSSDIIIDVDTESTDCTGGEQDDNENNKDHEENYQADDEEQGDDEQGDMNNDEQCNNGTTCTDTAGDNNNVNEASSAAPETNTVNQSNVKNEKKKWDKKKNNKASGKGGGGGNNQNGNTNANNKNNSNSTQSKNPQQNNINNHDKDNSQNNNQTKSSHQQNNNSDNNNKNQHNNNNTKNDNLNSEKNNQDNKNKSQHGDNQGNKTNNQGNQNKTNHHNNNNQNKPNHNSNNNQNNNYNKSNSNSNSSSSNSNSNSNTSMNTNSNNNKDNNSKGASGVGGLDLLRTIRGLIHYPKRYERPWPLDSFVLRLHYRMGVAIFILGFLCIKGNWHNYSHTTKCGFNADTNPSAIYENICLSYPFVEEVSGLGPIYETTRRYLLFYRWVYWSFLILAGLFYMPRIFSKQMDNPRLRKLLEELNSQESRYDSNGWEKNCETILSYLHHHQGTHLWLYFNLIICHVFALVIDIGTILFFNFILDGRFLYLLYHVWPLNRDPESFQDPLSSAFPPFAKCELSGSVVLIMAGRIEQCYVHLTLMELYEKVFLMLWIWLLVMVILAAFQILALFIMFLPFTHVLLLSTATSNKNIRKMKNKVMKTYGLGDIYALFVIKKRISDAEFRYLLSKLTKIEEENVESNDKLKKYDVTDQNIGNYQRNINTQWLVDEFPPNAPSYPDVTHPPDLSLGDFFPPDYLRQRAVSTPKPPSTQQVVPAFPIQDAHMGQPKYGWNSALYRQACYNQTNDMNSPKKSLASHAV